MVPMIPTYVYGWPSGKETGPYLAVDLGGTNVSPFSFCIGSAGTRHLLQLCSCGFAKSHLKAKANSKYCRRNISLQRNRNKRLGKNYVRLSFTLIGFEPSECTVLTVDFCAECLASFIHDNYGDRKLEEKLPLGFTFSYPCTYA